MEIFLKLMSLFFMAVMHVCYLILYIFSEGFESVEIVYQDALFILEIEECIFVNHLHL